MSKEKNTDHKDPALIPVPIYNAKNQKSHAHDMFISSEMLDRAFPPGIKEELVEKMESLAETVNTIRTEMTDFSNRTRPAVGKGFRNYGFMMASNQSINNFPDLAPNFIDIDSFNAVVNG